MIKEVIITKKAIKQLRGIPFHISSKLKAWIDLVSRRGVEKVRLIPGYHDEPLKGKRKGQRSIRLTKAYRAIYEIHKIENCLIVIIEVIYHDY